MCPFGHAGRPRIAVSRLKAWCPNQLDDGAVNGWAGAIATVPAVVGIGGGIRTHDFHLMRVLCYLCNTPKYIQDTIRTILKIVF